MFNTFYIIGREDWYQLIIKETHFCVSCGGDLDKILNMAKTYVKRYRTPERLFKALRKTNYGKGGRVSPATFEQREQEYVEQGQEYKDLLTATIEEAFMEMRDEGKKTLNRTMTRVRKAGGVKPLTGKTIEKEEPKKLLGKPKLIKRK